MATNPLRQIELLLRQNKVREAASLCQRLTRSHGHVPDVWKVMGRIAQVKADTAAMVKSAERLEALAPNDVAGPLLRSQAHVQEGRIRKAVACLEEIENRWSDDVDVLQQIAEFYTHAGRFDLAKRCHLSAAKLQPDNPAVLYNLATSHIATGGLDKAEDLLDRVIELKPDDFEAWQNRSTLRKQTPERNHVRELEGLVARRDLEAARKVPLHYALAKEYEDLGRYDEAFVQFSRGASARRSQMAYRVEADLETMNRIMRVFDNRFSDSALQGFEEVSPIFVLGLPRSGTTLVDRILSSHTEVESLGEINDFAICLTRAVGPVKSKEELVERSAKIDFEALGRTYVANCVERSHGGRVLLDKTPSNFLYIGIILKALPNARVVHLRRHPLDSCFAMYKTLFRMGYPFSYDLDDLARYYLVYDALMKHWDNLFGERVLTVHYEDLVGGLEPVAREMVAYCGLEWQDACLEFHKNESPSATASAAQVRQPLYSSAVARWKRYEKGLSGLKQALSADGIELD